MRTRDHFSAISHLVGAMLSVAGLVLLMVLAARDGTVWHIIGFSIFGASLISLYSVSAMYHLFHIDSRTRRIFKRLDHSFIFVLIAGTFTPICLTVLRGPWGWALLSVIWACAAMGIVVKNVWRVPSWASTLFYVIMGWIAVIPIVPLYKALPLAALMWLFFGGVLYTVGALFYARSERRPTHGWFNQHDLFHLFVIGGSLCHFAVMYYLV